MSKHLKDDELPVEDTEGHVRTYPAVTSEDDTEGHASRIALRRLSDDQPDETEGHLRLRVTDDDTEDTEGHRLPPRLVEPDQTEGIVSRRL